jgi:hypothetical protein
MNNHLEEFFCPNCEQSFYGNYCHHCGQKKINDEELKVKNVLFRVAHEISDIDSKFFKTVKLLITRPGFLTLEYFKGRRNAYYDPLKLFIIIGIIYFIVYSKFPMDSVLTLRRLKIYDFTGHLTESTDTMRTLLGWDRIKFERVFSDKLREVFSQVMYFEVILYAFWFFLIYRTKRKLYFHHLIFSFHFLSFFYLRDIIFLPIYHLGEIFIWIFNFGTTTTYATISMHIFYQEPIWKSALKTFIFCGLFFATSAASKVLSAFIIIYFTGLG